MFFGEGPITKLTGATGEPTGATGEDTGDIGEDTGGGGEPTGDTGWDTGGRGWPTGDTGWGTGATGWDTGATVWLTGRVVGPVGATYCARGALNRCAESTDCACMFTVYALGGDINDAPHANDTETECATLDEALTHLRELVLNEMEAGGGGGFDRYGLCLGRVD